MKYKVKCLLDEYDSSVGGVDIDYKIVDDNDGEDGLMLNIDANRNIIPTR